MIPKSPGWHYAQLLDNTTLELAQCGSHAVAFNILRKASPAAPNQSFVQYASKNFYYKCAISFFANSRR